MTIFNLAVCFGSRVMIFFAYTPAQGHGLNYLDTTGQHIRSMISFYFIFLNELKIPGAREGTSKMEVELDSISNLPREIAEKILARLPIKEAVRTSILSTKWRYKPAMLQNLKFDKQCVSTQNHITFANIVDQVLLLHIGPIHKFELTHRDFLASADIDRWVLHLSRSCVKCLKLVIWKGHRIATSFMSLEHLDIRHVTLAQHVFEDFIVCCPVPKRLILKYCDGFTNLCIDAPNLKLPDIDGVVLRMFVFRIPYILNMLTSVWNSKSDGLLAVHPIWSSFSFTCLIFVTFKFQYLAVGPLLRKLPQPVLFLNDLYMDVNFTDLEEITTALCLVRSSPALRKLEIVVNHIDYHHVVGEVNSWFENLGENSDCQLTELQCIEIVAISDAKAELDFIKLLLLSSPVLECMTLKPFSVDGSLEPLKQLIRFRCASVQAEIILLDP
ncbi:putative F-box domain-containing protein [Rosa chinensis]|uniref:Putative F-box domain-containing protein n=1 Tax=Rosa chinensis TaxID=74649 RepID=A0A2P6P2X4_ROSCH|nr:putative F-box domain-containing protein [Rosa chinensis]